jgi:flagellar hook-basal body complex protein FliE
MTLHGISPQGIGGIGGGGLQSVGPQTQVAPAPEGGGGFGALLDGLGQTQADADAALVDLAVGGEMDLHDVVLAVEMESIAFELAVQIRNRLVDAYQEIFRMTV